MNLDEFAGAAEALADRAQAELALVAVRPGAREYLAVLQMETPVRSGALRASETVRSVTGDGTHAEAIAGPDIVYDAFRNDGGTIDAKEGLGRKGKRPHTLHWEGGGFPLHVTQHGDHYMERARDMAPPLMEAAMRIAVSDFLTI